MARSTARLAVVATPIAACALLLVPSSASAQEMAPPPPPPMTTTVETKSEVSDHSLVVGRLGIGYFGQFDVPLGAPLAAGGEGAPQPAQVIGVRYWMQEKVGLDLGLGWAMRSGSNTADGTSVDRASTLTLALRGGLPISLFDSKHYTFFIEPEIAYGHAGETIKAIAPGGGAPTPADTSLAGHRFAIGAKAGAEVHFGFIGIPQLSLDATVGLDLDVSGGSTKGQRPGAAAGQTVENSYSQLELRTLSFHQPWNIFISNVAAIYYF